MHLSIWVDFDSNPWSELLCQNSHSAYLLESRTNLTVMQDEVHAAGRTLTGLYDAVAQYCGAPFGEQRPETWAFPYFDLIPLDESRGFSHLDVVASAALHPNLRNEDLRYFDDLNIKSEWASLLHSLPEDLDLGDAEHFHVQQIARIYQDLQGFTSPNGYKPSLSLLTKVLHRRRPRLIPIFDRAMIDFYRPVTRQRGESTWPQLVEALHGDLANPENRNVLRWVAEGVMDRIDQPGAALSELRCFDIAVWMKWQATRPPMDRPRGKPMSPEDRKRLAMRRERIRLEESNPRYDTEEGHHS